MEGLTRKTFIPATVKFSDVSHTSVPQPAPAEDSKAQPKVNTNIMAINFAEIEKSNFIATGDPIRCERCLAYFNTFSQYDKITKTWICEFCDYPNIISLETDVIPQKDIITYISPNQQIVKSPSHTSGTNDATVIFCIDISASMSTSTPCNTKLKYMTSSRNISRLECVKLAVDDQLQKLSKNAPTTKVGIVFFCDKVVFVGDGSVPDHKLTCDLADYSAVLAETDTLVGKYATKPVSSIMPDLLKKLEEIGPEGSTALGPALLMSVSLLTKQGNPGSKVILCTDGAANTGIGQVGSECESALQDYQKMGELAQSKGVVVSLISLIEEDCRLDIVAPCAMKTGGNIVKLDPKELAGDFSEFIQEKIIAFDCTIAVKLHRAMKFVTVVPSDIGYDSSVLIKKLGNVVPTTSFTFEYIVKSPAELSKERIDVSKLKQAPFQALINYVGPDKVRYCKVLSKIQPITNESQETAPDISVDVLSAHSNRKVADYALQGNMKEATQTTQMYRTLVVGKVDAEAAYNGSVSMIENSVKRESDTPAYRQGYRSDHLVATVAMTQKFTPSFKRSPNP